MRRLLSFTLLVAFAVFAMLLTQTSEACFIRAPQPVQVWLDHIYVEIVDQVAVKTYDCTFKNPNATAVVNGTCYMELEPDAQVDDMTVVVDGKKMKAEILDVDEAKQVFTDIVKEGGSPALLEYFGKQLIQTKIPKIPAGGTVNVKLRYTTVLKKQGDLVRLQMLNTNPKTLKQTLKSASVTVNIRSTEPIKNVYSPTHTIKVSEDKDWDVSVKWSQENYKPTHPFVLYYQTSNDYVAAGLLAHKHRKQPGHFMMLVSPSVGKKAKKKSEESIQPKDVIFCVDTSGSMLEGNKITQAKDALRYCIKNLRKGDRFNIVDFSTTIRRLKKDGLIKVNKQSIKDALDYVDDLAAKGGTAIQSALVDSMMQFPNSDRLKMIVFATDGLPTVGNRDPDAILKAVAEANTRDVRLHVFGEGYDVNTKLLDFLAHENRGDADYITPDEKIAEKISVFFDRVGSPIMTDVEIDIEGVEVTDMFPVRISDIHQGEQVVVYGKYTGSGNGIVHLSGMVNGKRKTIDYEVEFPEKTKDDNGYIPRLWAGRKVDFLMKEIRRDANASEELVKEVTQLATRYGIITPYTSFLMGEDILGKDKEQLAQSANRRYRGLTTAPQSGFGAVILSKREADRKKSSSESGAAGLADQQAADAFTPRSIAAPGGKSNESNSKVNAAIVAGGLELEESESGTRTPAKNRVTDLKYIGNRTFYKKGSVWYEDGFNTEKTKIKKTLTVGSDEYIAFLLKNTELAQYLALESVVLKSGDDWIQFSPKSEKSS